MKKLFFLSLCLFCSSELFASSIVKLPLETVEKQALEFSPKIRQAQAAAEAQQSVYESFDSYLYPSVTFDAKGGWVSKVPEMKLGYNALKFGDNWSYSLGPSLSYTVFDNGKRNDKVKSETSSYLAKKHEVEAVKKQVLLETRKAYFKIQRDLERIYFLFEYMKLTQKQFQDINSSFKIGSKSRLDVIMAEKQFLKSKIEISAARAVLSQDLSELFKITCTDFSINADYPSDYRISSEELDGAVSSVIEVDSPDSSLQKLSPFEKFSFDILQDRLLSYDETVKAYEYMSDFYKSELYPKINFSAGTYFEYPNGPIVESISQTRTNAVMSMPLFEKSRTKKQAESQKSISKSVIFQKQDVIENLKNVFDFSKRRLYSLKIESGLVEEMIDDSKTAVKLTYDAYNAGTVTFLEVQNANIDLLSAQTELANLKIEKLNCLAVMDNLGK
ncbi:MAG: TolC family protein [Endomicrobiaceae bacterium]